jgi:hypothetical protein
MKSYGNLDMAEGTEVINLTVNHGETLPTTTANMAELFYKTGTSAGLYVFTGSSWVNISTAGAVTSYNFVQATPSTTWNINHNLNTTNVTYSFSVYVGETLTPVLPAGIVIADNNTISVTFSQAFTGKATLIASLV